MENKVIIDETARDYTVLPRELRLIIITHNTYRLGQVWPFYTYFGRFKDDPARKHYLFFVPKEIWQNFLLLYGKSFRCYHNIRATVSFVAYDYFNQYKYLAKMICGKSNWRIKLNTKYGIKNLREHIQYFAGTNVKFTLVHENQYLYKCDCSIIIKLMDLEFDLTLKFSHFSNGFGRDDISDMKIFERIGARLTKLNIISGNKQLLTLQLIAGLMAKSPRMKFCWLGEQAK